MDEQWVFMNIDTLGLEETSMILSIGVLFIEPECENMDKYELLNECQNVLLDNTNLNPRLWTKDIDTMKMWASLDKNFTFDMFKNKNREKHDAVYHIIKNYLMTLHDFDPKNAKVFSKGFSDQKWWNHFCSASHFENFIPHWCWRDVRTALDLLTGQSNPVKHTADILPYKSCYECVDSYMSIRDAINHFGEN